MLLLQMFHYFRTFFKLFSSVRYPKPNYICVQAHPLEIIYRESLLWDARNKTLFWILYWKYTNICSNLGIFPFWNSFILGIRRFSPFSVWNQFPFWKLFPFWNRLLQIIGYQWVMSREYSISPGACINQAGAPAGFSILGKFSFWEFHIGNFSHFGIGLGDGWVFLG